MTSCVPGESMLGPLLFVINTDSLDLNKDRLVSHFAGVMKIVKLQIKLEVLW